MQTNRDRVDIKILVGREALQQNLPPVLLLVLDLLRLLVLPLL